MGEGRRGRGKMKNGMEGQQNIKKVVVLNRREDKERKKNKQKSRRKRKRN